MISIIKNEEKTTNGITLIALVITIIILLILARNNNCNFNRRKWHFSKSRYSKRRKHNKKIWRTTKNYNSRNKTWK